MPQANERNERDEVSPASGAPAWDYEVSIDLTFDFEDYSARENGLPGRATSGRYAVAAGRKGGAWRMRVDRVVAECAASGEVIAEPVGYDVAGQTGGPDPLALLHALLGNRAVLDGTRYVRDLDARELAALRLASPALRAELVDLMQRERDADGDGFAAWFGRWALTASPADLAGGFSHSDPRYAALAARIADERLHAKVLAAEARGAALHAEALAALAERAA
jgi:hypothetical protein